METRSRARQAEEFCEIPRSQNNDGSDNDDLLNDSESDHEEELEGSDVDNSNHTEDIASDGEKSDDDIASQKAEKIKKRRTSETVSRGTKFIYGKNCYKWSLNPPESGFPLL